jgi:hypothetical protein
MNDLSLQPKVQAHPAVTWVLLGLMVLFALNSYPMMYPGYDFVHHLVIIKFLGNHANNDWHQVWAFVFQTLQVSDGDPTRALIIHRTQTALVLGLLLASGHLFLGMALPKLGANARLQLAVVATMVWLVMHGTYSSPAGEPHHSARHVLSWLQWYSVNYQISLPLSVFACATLYRAVHAHRILQALTWGTLTAVVAYLAARAHAAELVYFLFAALGMMLIQLLTGKNWRLLLFAAVLGAAVLWLGLIFSYRQPLILELVHPSRWGELVNKMNEFGHLLVGSNLNRSETTWHSLYSVSLLAAVGSVFWANNNGALQLALLLVFSSLLAIGIQIHHSAGLLALVIGEYVTWRFGFSTLLFLGIPLLVGVWLERRPHTDSPLRTSVLALGVPTGLLVLVALYSRFFEPLQPAYNFVKSLLFSLDPVLGHFSGVQP